MAKLLILGGTAEARALAAEAAERPGLAVVTSLAGRTRAPIAPKGALRRGGFGGAEGLAAYLRAEGIDLVVDASHPFAATISGHAVEACAATGTPLLRLARPPWRPVAGDHWIEVADLEAAARQVSARGGRVFLAVGAQGLRHFADLPGVWRLARMIDPPESGLSATFDEAIVARGPFTEDDERALLRRHDIALLVSRNSGGEGPYTKIAAARALGLPVIMIRRPDIPGPSVATVAQALEWLRARLVRRPE